MKKLINILREQIGNKIFTKIMVINSCVIVAILIALSIIVSSTIRSTIMTNNMEYSKLVVDKLNSFIDEKYNDLLTAVKRIYLDYGYGTDQDPIEFLKNPEDPSIRGVQNKKKFFSFVDSFFSRDQDIENIVVYVNANQRIYHFSKSSIVSYSKNEYAYPDRLEQIDSKVDILKVYPGTPEIRDSKGNQRYIFSYNIKSPINVESNIALAMIEYSARGFTQLLSQYDNEFMGQIVVTSGQGKVLFDSTNEFFSEKYPYFDRLTSQNKIINIENKNYIINMSSSNKLDLIVTSIASELIWMKKVRITQNAFIYITASFIILSLLLTLPIEIHSSRRMKMIIEHMNKVRYGNLSSRILISKNKDEIDKISESFNEMNIDLQKHIDNEYVSSIKRKNSEIALKSAELIALQAQINPHFLYNALETIRMKAIVNSDLETGNMILLLSKIFRITFRGDTIVNIHDEINNVTVFLDFLKMRYGDSIKVIFKIDSDLYKYSIVKHTLQPIIENYFMYGFDSSRTDNRITVTGEMNDNNILMTVIDNGIGIPQHKIEEIRHSLDSIKLDDIRKFRASTGLANINGRIKLIYGEDFGLAIQSIENEGTTVSILFSARTEEDLLSNI